MNQSESEGAKRPSTEQSLDKWKPDASDAPDEQASAGHPADLTEAGDGEEAPGVNASDVKSQEVVEQAQALPPVRDSSVPPVEVRRQAVIARWLLILFLVVSPVYSIFVFAGGAWIQSEIGLFSERPLISGEPLSILLVQNLAGDWRLLLHYRITNEGHRATSSRLAHLTLRFPSMDGRELRFKSDRSTVIPALTAIDDSISMSMAGFMPEIDTIEDFPELSGGTLELVGLDGETEHLCEFTSTDIESVSHLETGSASSVEHFPGAQAAEGRGFVISMKVLPVQLGGQQYHILTYPPDAAVDYQEIEGRLRLEFTQRVPNVTAGTEMLIPPTVVIPDPRIHGLVDVPEFVTLQLNREIRSNDHIEYRDEQMVVGNMSAVRQYHLYKF